MTRHPMVRAHRGRATLIILKVSMNRRSKLGQGLIISLPSIHSLTLIPIRPILMSKLLGLLLVLTRILEGRLHQHLLLLRIIRPEPQFSPHPIISTTRVEACNHLLSSLALQMVGASG